MPISRRIPNEELAQYGSNIAGLNEVKRFTLYDTVRFAAAATVQNDVSFFTEPFGGGTPAKTLLETNLRQASQLPASHILEIWDIRVHPRLTVVSDDASVVALNNLYDTFDALIYGGSFLFKQAQKDELEIAPVAILAAGYGATVAAWGGANITAGAAAGAGAAILNNGHPSRAALFNMAPLPIIITPQNSFQVRINYPTAVVLPAGVALRYIVHLDGVIHRAA